MLKKGLIILLLMISSITIFGLSYQEVMEYSTERDTITVNGEKIQTRWEFTGSVCPGGRYYVVQKKVVTELEFYNDCREIQLSYKVNGNIITFTDNYNRKKIIKYDVKTRKIVK